MSQGHRAALAHPIAQLSRHIWSIWADGLGETEALNWENATSPDPVDIAARSLKAVPCAVLDEPHVSPTKSL